MGQSSLSWLCGINALLLDDVLKPIVRPDGYSQNATYSPPPHTAQLYGHFGHTNFKNLRFDFKVKANKLLGYDFKEFGENLGTRPLGKRVREQLLPMIEQNDCVVLDFTGVDVVSNSFADECIAKLLLVMSLSELKSRTTFRGLNPIASESVLTALRRRHLTTA